jgi:hypothetical protein
MLLYNRITRLFLILATLFALAACGGGGTGSPLGNGTGGGDTGTGDTGDTGTDTTTTGIELSVELYDENVDLADLAGSTVVSTVNSV